MEETKEFKFGLILWSPMYAFSTQQQALIHGARSPMISNPKISPVKKKYLLQNENKKYFFFFEKSGIQMCSIANPGEIKFLFLLLYPAGAGWEKCNLHLCI